MGRAERLLYPTLGEVDGMVTQLPWIYRAVMPYLAVMTLAGFLSMGWDKLMAKKGRWRVPERTLLLIAALGGSLGSILGMEVFHHKTRHKKFSWGLPAIFLLQCVLVALVFSQF